VSGYREKPTAFDCYVGACLRATRMAYGWSLAEAAARSGVLAVNLQAWETGRRSCSLETLEVLARFYRARVTDFLPVNEPAVPSPRAVGTEVRRRTPGAGRSASPAARPSS